MSREIWGKEMHDFEGYLKMVKGLSDSSINAYLADLRKMLLFFEEKKIQVSPLDVKIKHLQELMEWITEKGISGRTQARIVSGIKSFYKYLILEEKIEKDPTSTLAAPKIDRKLPTILSVSEIDSIIHAVDIRRSEGQRNKAILEMLFSCGLRVSELIDLKVSNLFFENGMIRVVGKNNKERLIPVSTRAIKETNLYLSEYRRTLIIHPKDGDTLFLNRRGRKLSRVMIFTIVKNMAQKAGIQKTISPHTFRHSYATAMVKGGANLRQIQEFLGHHSIITTEIYAKLDAEYLQDTLSLYHPRANE